MRNIIRKRKLREKVPLSDTTIWRYERDGKFPRRVILGDSGIVGWYEDEVDKWVADRVRAGGKRPSRVAAAVPRPGRAA